MGSHDGWKRNLQILPLDAARLSRFDCGRREQNQYLQQIAVRDQELRLAITRLFVVEQELAGFVTLMVEAVELGTREKDRGVRYRSLPAVKVAQLGVDLRFGGRGMGKFILAWSIQTARLVAAIVGVRYVTVDAKPDLENWYGVHGFIRNKVVQKRREDGRSGEPLPVSMRFDLLK